MAGLIFWDVDTPYDFMRADGKLHLPGAEKLIPEAGLQDRHRCHDPH